MNWLQISIDTNESEAPLLELVFNNLGALSITLGDAGDQPLLELPPDSQQLWHETRVTALFEGDRDLWELRQALSIALEGRLLERLHWERIEDRLWERVWLEYFKPMRFGRRLWICPVGEQVVAPDSILVELDPGLAFGTGTHPTTALCLEWLDSLDLRGKTLIDYGCGSGILAIAALKLGAENAIAIDHDPQALQASRDNAKKNNVSGALITCLPSAIPDTISDVLVANILAGPLMALAPTLAGLIKPGGAFALSGILTEQQDEVATQYQAIATLSAAKRRDEWILIEGVVHP